MAPFKRTNRLATGGLVAVVAIVALSLSGLFSGIGGGGGGGTGEVSVQTPETGSANNVSNTEELPDPPTNVEPAEPAAGVVDVVIEEQSYFLRDGDRLQPVELSELVALARESPGNEDGIRVRITRAASSRPSAEETLVNELMTAGVARDALLLRDGF